MPNDEAVKAIGDMPDALLTCILDMGEILLTSGAEIIRVEDTLNRLCSAYGFTQINVFSITSSIVLTAHCPDDRVRVYMAENPAKWVEDPEYVQ